MCVCMVSHGSQFVTLFGNLGKIKSISNLCSLWRERYGKVLTIRDLKTPWFLDWPSSYQPKWYDRRRFITDLTQGFQPKIHSTSLKIFVRKRVFLLQIQGPHQEGFLLKCVYISKHHIVFFMVSLSDDKYRIVIKFILLYKSYHGVEPYGLCVKSGNVGVDAPLLRVRWRSSGVWVFRDPP